jgi:hypothetical protein
VSERILVKPPRPAASRCNSVSLGFSPALFSRFAGKFAALPGSAVCTECSPIEIQPFAGQTSCVHHIPLLSFVAPGLLPFLLDTAALALSMRIAPFPPQVVLLAISC